MIKEEIKKEIDKIVKEVWLNEICNEYAKGALIKEASLQCSLYHHLQNRLQNILQENNLFIYPECYFKDFRYRADLAIVEMDMTKECSYLWDRMTDIAAIIELKYDSGTAKTTEDYIKSDKAKIKKYIDSLPYECQYYFGVIYETECRWLHWFDKRSTNKWANGRLTELNAGYLEGKMHFEVNSYNNWNIANESKLCNIQF